MLRPIVDAFMDVYPTVSAWLHLFDRPVNLVDEGVDVALRIAHLEDLSMVAVRVGEVRWVVVAARRYLARHPRIDEPSDLTKHQIIAMAHLAHSWSFPALPDSSVARPVQFTPRLVINSIRGAWRRLLPDAALRVCYRTKSPSTYARESLKVFSQATNFRRNP